MSTRIYSEPEDGNLTLLVICLLFILLITAVIVYLCRMIFCPGDDSHKQSVHKDSQVGSPIEVSTLRHSRLPVHCNGGGGHDHSGKASTRPVEEDTSAHSASYSPCVRCRPTAKRHGHRHGHIVEQTAEKTRRKHRDRRGCRHGHACGKPRRKGTRK